MIVEAADLDDLPALALMWAQEWHIASKAPDFDPIRQAERWRVKVEHGGEYFTVARHEQTLVGFARGNALTKLRTVGKFLADVEFETLVVHPESRGTGGGKALEHAMRRRLARVGAIAVIDVEWSRPDTFEFWKRCGWTFVQDEPNAGSGNSGRHVLVHDLSDSQEIE